MASPLAAARAQALADDAAEHFASGRPGLWTPPGPSSLPRNNNIGFEYESEDQAFPAAPIPWQPLGTLVMVQIRQPLLRSTGGLVIDANNRQTDHDNTQVGKVVAIGPLAFRNRETGQLWPEGAWCAIGDYVRIPKYQGDRSVVEITREDHDIDDRTGKRIAKTVRDNVVFVAFKDLAIIGKYADAAAALAARAFL
jgi:co-chaperonin GroES (HSP10)